MATKNPRDIALAEMEAAFGLVPAWARKMPAGAWPGFWSQLRDFAQAETAIPAKHKELIGLAVSAATHCRYGVYLHTVGARLRGATEEEVAEAGMMAGLTMAGDTCLNALNVDYNEFIQDVDKMVAFARALQPGRQTPLEAGELR